MRRLWQTLLSVRTALTLILLLTLATFAGTMLAQVPASIPLDGADYAAWVETVRPRFGMWTDALALLGVFNVFRAWWYQALVGALSASLLACSVHRWRTISREVLHPQVRVAPAVFDRAGAVVTESAAGQGAASEALQRALAARGYRVLRHERADALHLYADRNRFARFGTVVAHLSLVLLLVGAALGARLGWSDEAFVVAEGSTRDVGIAGLAVHATSFVAEYYASGEPKDFRSDLVLYENGVEVDRKTIRVNDPLDYAGVRFYQSFFGPAAELRVTDASGAVVFDEAIPLAWRTEADRPAGSVSLTDQGLIAYVVAPSTSGGDPLIKPGQVRLELYRNGTSQPFAMRTLAQGANVEAGGLRFAFVRERQFTGLRVAHDPTLPIIWTASVLLVIGFSTVLLFPYRRLWARVSPTTGGSRLALLTVGRRSEDMQSELARIADEASRATKTKE